MKGVLVVLLRHSLPYNGGSLTLTEKQKTDL